MRPTPETVLQMASRIVDLKRELSEAQMKWDAMFREDVQPHFQPAPPAREHTAVPLAGVRANSAAGRVLAAINRSPSIDFAPLRISEDMGIPLGTTRTILSKLVKKSLIEKRGAAKYGCRTAREKVVPSDERNS